MAWLYYPTEFERACIDAFYEVFNEVHKKKGSRINLNIKGEDPYFKDVHPFFGYDVIYTNLATKEQSTIAGVYTMVDGFPNVDIVGEGELSDELKTKIFSDPLRTNYLELHFPDVEALDCLTLWFYPKKNKLSLVEYFSNDEDVCRKFPLYKEWVAEAEKVKKCDYTSIHNIARTGLEVVLEAHKIPIIKSI